MPANKHRSLFRKTSYLFIALATTLSAVPVANNDTFKVDEDRILIISSGDSILSANFGGGSSVLSSTWQYLDRIKNENGSNQTYPLDGNGLSWNSPQYDTATSTSGPWSAGNAPFQGGTIDGFPPGTPAVLGGLAAAGNGENLITTYLFRQQFSLSAAEAFEDSWVLGHLIDDGGIIYLNGTEVFRTDTMPAGVVTTNTLSQNANETNFGSTTLDLSGIIQEGINTVAVEVHQTTLTSTDVGLSVNLIPASSSPLAGFTYADDTFNNTSRPNNADGELDPTGGFTGGALSVQVGRRLDNNQSTSGGWLRTFTLENPAVTTISFRYRLTFSDDYKADEYGEALFEIDGIRYGNDIENSLVRFRGDGNGGNGLDDSGWQNASFDISLDAGDHTIVLGAFSSKSTAANELTTAWFDDVEISIPESGGGVLINDTGDEPQAILQTAPQNGVLSLNPDGSFIYRPALNFNGIDSFTYFARDPGGDSPVATVTLTVNPVNDLPVALPDNYSGVENSTLVQFAPGLLGNDTDIENDQLSAVLVNDVSQGTLSLNSDGSFVYNPDPGFFGTDSFTYRASDGKLDNRGERIRLEITNINAGIHDFEYDDWYPASDGTGFSLEFSDTSLPVEGWNLKPNWAPGLTINGTPGNSGTFFVSTPPSETITLPDSLTIDPFVSYGSISPASVTFQWELLNGPAPVSFTTPGEASTEISFDLPGTYHLRLNATAFDFDRSQEVEVTVHDSYPAWVSRTFGNATPGQTDKENDPDDDGISNFFEFALGMDPTIQDSYLFPVPVFDPESKTLSLTWTNQKLDAGNSPSLPKCQKISKHGGADLLPFIPKPSPQRISRKPSVPLISPQRIKPAPASFVCESLALMASLPTLHRKSPA